jgi:hypothetical protein
LAIPEQPGNSPAIVVVAHSSFELYGGVTSVTLNDSIFAGDLGLGSAILPSFVIIQNFGIETTTATGGISPIDVASATLTVATPEPSPFALFALCLLAAASIEAGRKPSFSVRMGRLSDSAA